MDKKEFMRDAATIARVVDSLRGLPWEEKIFHLCTASQAVAGDVVGAVATRHREACEALARSYAEALAQLMARMVDEDAAAKAAN